MKKLVWGLIGLFSFLGAMVSVERGLNSTIGSGFIYFSVFAVAGTVYFAPILIANFRGHRNEKAICALTALGGWTVVGWVGALVWAFTSNVAPSEPILPKQIVRRLVGLTMLPVGLYAVGVGLKEFGSPKGMMWQINNSLAESFWPYLPGWIPVLLGCIFLLLGSYLLIQDRTRGQGQTLARANERRA